jgi:hypothetical protein
VPGQTKVLKPERSGANMSVIQFWTRKLAILFLFALASACGGGGDGSAPSTPPFGTASTLFVGDAGQQAIGSSSNSNPPPGTAVIQRVVSGPNTMLSPSLIDFALDVTRDRLYVADLRSILAFDSISTISGNVAPRVISSFSTPGNFVGIDLDRTNDVIYAGVNLGATNEVRVFTAVSTANNALPSRTFSFSSNLLIDVAIDPTKNILYVFNVDSVTLRTQIAVFDNAVALSGSRTPNRVITIGDTFSSGTPAGIFIDTANNRLYAPRGNGQVMVFDNANVTNGDVATTAMPSRTIALPVPSYTNITVDVSKDRLYAVDNGGLNIINNANAITPTATRALAPSGSLFTAVAVKP